MTTREIYRIIRERLTPRFTQLGYRPVKSNKLPTWSKPWQGRNKLVFFTVDPRFPYDRTTGGDFAIKFLLSDTTETDDSIANWNNSHVLLELEDSDLFSEILSIRRRVTEKILAQEPADFMDDFSLFTFRSLAELSEKLGQDKDLRQDFWHYLDRDDLGQWLDLFDRWLPRLDAFLEK